MALKLQSSLFDDKAMMPKKFTCQGDNINPPLIIQDIPAKTKSLALVMDDPDAATDPDGFGDTFVHWVLFNISPDNLEIPEANIPAGSVTGLNSANKPGYTGPCPPNGTHRYFFKLYALDTGLNLGTSATKSDIEIAMKDHVIEQTELVGLYQKS